MAETETPPDDTPDDDQPDDSDDQQEEAEYKPPSKEEWEKVSGAAKKARDERDKVRAELAASRREKQTEEEKAAEQAAEQNRWKTTAVTNAAISALQNAGYGKPQARYLAKNIDLSGVELDDDGEIDLDAQIDELAKTFPPEKYGRSTGRVTTGRGREGSQPKDDVDTRFAKRLLGMR